MRREIAVLGAGVLGLTTALRLAQRGHGVTRLRARGGAGRAGLRLPHRPGDERAAGRARGLARQVLPPPLRLRPPRHLADRKLWTGRGAGLAASADGDAARRAGLSTRRPRLRPQVPADLDGEPVAHGRGVSRAQGAALAIAAGGTHRRHLAARDDGRGGVFGCLGAAAQGQVWRAGRGDRAAVVLGARA